MTARAGATVLCGAIGRRDGLRGRRPSGGFEAALAAWCRAGGTGGLERRLVDAVVRPGRGGATMDSSSVDRLRAAVVAEARRWIGTPYRHMGRVRGAGTDCLMLLAEIYEAAGIIPHVEVPFYPPDWNLHREAERYLDGVTAHARELDWDGCGPAPAQAGDVAVFKFGRCFAHGAIVTAWPRLIHAFVGVGVVEADATQGGLRRRPVRLFSPFPPVAPPPVRPGRGEA